jgi:hypothetical protein
MLAAFLFLRGAKMFHIGKVMKMVLPRGKGIISADSSVQAMVKMWDDNLLMLEVDKKIANAIKEKDYVIADYSPVAPNSPHRRMIITKIVRGELGKQIWDEFGREFDKRKSKNDSAPQLQPMPMPYIR